MHIIIEFLTAAVIWVATLAFAQLGVDIDLNHQGEPTAERVVRRTAAPVALPIAHDCPDAAARAVARTAPRAA